MNVVVTGIGVLSPAGSAPAALWTGVASGQSFVRRVTRFDPAPFRSQVAGEIADFDPEARLDRKLARRLDRFSALAVVAAEDALRDAALENIEQPEEFGVSIGSALGGAALAEEQHRRYLTGGIGAVRPVLAISVFGAAAACNVAQQCGLHGPVLGNTNSCAAGVTAIGEACMLMRQGRARRMLAGGVEAPLAPLTFGAFDLLRAMSAKWNDAPERSSRPFDRARDGFVMAEAAAVLMLEREEDAVRRGARIYGCVAGFGLSNDAFHMSAPREDGSDSARSMLAALADAGMTPEEVECVSAHGSATPPGDTAEARALEQVLGERLARVPVIATKGCHGHALGATGAVEVAIALLAMERGEVPPSANADDPEPSVATATTARPMRIANVLKNTAGFGGLNAALVLRREA
ncbi:beta-ketoacyl-[acyl-carrier-protein] synthase family protein [bacterium]|nr:MAG: beta-ketoacyl-[acyl-carrier-protein] synthase family protein [bacterium]